jgi:hypothetical protein
VGQISVAKRGHFSVAKNISFNINFRFATNLAKKWLPFNKLSGKSSFIKERRVYNN